MRMRNLAFGLSMTLGVQLMPGYWVKDDQYLVPNSQYVPKGGSDYQSKTGTKGGAKTGAGSSTGTSGGSSGTSGGSGTGGSGGSGFGSGGGGSGSGGGSTGSGRDGACGLVEVNAPVQSGALGPKWETNLNDALPYDWAKKFWLCGCPGISLEGTGLYWQSRPIIMCIL